MHRLPAGILLGIGLGGFLDGIVLHQLLQWHHMLSAVWPPTTMEAMRRNMVWDGAFHLATWGVTLAGVVRLWRDGVMGTTASGWRLAGQFAAGWGAFNLVEGAIDHHLLDLHHVRDVPEHVPALDWLFLAIGGVGLLCVGLALARHGARRR